MPNEFLKSATTRPWVGHLRCALLCAGLLLWLSGTAHGVGDGGGGATATGRTLTKAPLEPELDEVLSLHAYEPVPRPVWARHAYPMIQGKELRATEARLAPVQDAIQDAVKDAMARMAFAGRPATTKTEGFDPTGLPSSLTGAFFVQPQNRKPVLLLLLETRDPHRVCHACSPWQSAFEYEQTPRGWKLKRAHIAFDRVGSWGRSAPYLVLSHPWHAYAVAYDYAYLAQGKMTKRWIFYSPVGGVMRQTGSRPSRTRHGDDPL